MFNSDQVDLPKDLLPVSRVMVRALTCRNYNQEHMEHLFAYVREAQNLWQTKQDPQQSSDAGVYYFVLALRELEAQKILSHDGRILRPQEFATSDKMNGCLCRPRGCAPVILQKTAEFQKMMNPSGLTNSRQPKEMV